ncbi:hypothetical protein DENSPDRAFT_839664 [Dentipellis sp. KUC8613]|nr:hypothetical protein DENSPDRAFT_839664 [Dentipellis sp. KUC8613]
MTQQYVETTDSERGSAFENLMVFIITEARILSIITSQFQGTRCSLRGAGHYGMFDDGKNGDGCTHPDPALTCIAYGATERVESTHAAVEQLGVRAQTMQLGE